MSRDDRILIAPPFGFTPPTPPNKPNGCGGKSKPDLAGGVWVIGVFALAFCGLELREEKSQGESTKQGGGRGLGRKVGFACGWIVGGLWVDCGMNCGRDSTAQSNDT